MSNTKARQCARGVNVTDPGGITHRFLPGDVIPGELVELVTNPKVWELDGDIPNPDPVQEAPDTDPESDEDEVDDDEAETEEFTDEDEDGADEGDEADEDLEALTVAQLKELAEAREIDLGSATRKADIIKVLKG